MQLLRKAALVVAMAAMLVPVLAAPASAQHSWNGYHWSRGSYPIDLRPINSFSAGFRNTDISFNVNADWNRSSRFANTQRYGANDAETRRTCPFPARSYRMCDYNWGSTGWAGIAEIRLSGRHITRARVRINNYYGTSNSYRRHVLCQEVGHVLGLDHQANGNHSCMDDSSAGWDELRPNNHDYNMLETIYDHSHSEIVEEEDGQDATHRHSAPAAVVSRLPNGEILIQRALPPLTH